MATKSDSLAIIPPLTRMCAPTFEPDAARAYADALAALERARVPYLLGGAVALNAHTGVWRDTKDLDVFVRPEDAPAALASLARAGFATETVYESWLGKAWRGPIFVDIIWRNANALFPVQSGWFEHATAIPLFGREAPVMPLEELILSKMMVMGRYRFDGADILHLLYTCAQAIDWERLGDLAGEHVGLLLAHLHVFRWAYPDARAKVPDEVLSNYGKLARDRESTLGPFRGRLLDIQSFEVDVQEWGMPDPHRLALERIFGDAEGRT